MMYLTGISMPLTVLKQYVCKLKSNRNLFVGLIITQVISVLFSFVGIGMMGTGSGSISFGLYRYSGEIIIWYTVIWAVTCAIILTTKTRVDIDFTFVTNRLSSSLSSIGFLLTASILGAVTASLCGILLRVVFYLSAGSENIIYDGYILSLKEILIGTTGTLFYLILFTAAGYLSGTLIQIRKVFIFIIPALLAGLAFTAAAKNGRLEFVNRAIGFFTMDSSLLFFIIKITAAAFLLFGSGVILSNRMEVRK